MTETNGTPGLRSVAALYALPVTFSVPTAGSFYSLGPDASYAAVRRGDFPVPVVRVGRRILVTRAALIAALDPEGEGRPQTEGLRDGYDDQESGSTAGLSGPAPDRLSEGRGP